VPVGIELAQPTDRLGDLGSSAVPQGRRSSSASAGGRPAGADAHLEAPIGEDG
jgi:hypothetical protein